MTPTHPQTAKDVRCIRRHNLWQITKGGRLMGVHGDMETAWDRARRLARDNRAMAELIVNGEIIDTAGGEVTA